MPVNRYLMHKSGFDWNNHAKRINYIENDCNYTTLEQSRSIKIDRLVNTPFVRIMYFTYNEIWKHICFHKIKNYDPLVIDDNIVKHPEILGYLRQQAYETKQKNKFK